MSDCGEIDGAFDVGALCQRNRSYSPGTEESRGHIGRWNRLCSKLEQLYGEIDASSNRPETYRALLAHPDPMVRSSTAWQCGWRQFLVDEAERAVVELSQLPEYEDQFIRWQKMRPEMEKVRASAAGTSSVAHFPEQPDPVSRERALSLIAHHFHGERRSQLAALLRRSIQISTCAHNGDPMASRFGGLPSLPPGTSWLTVEDEPLLFLGQLNFTEIHDATGDCPLPKHGLLLLFGDHDEVHGCGANLGHGVVEIDLEIVGPLKPAEIPAEGFKPNPECGLRFHQTCELPDPKSLEVSQLGFTPEEHGSYLQLIGEFDQGREYDCDRSKLFGWPNLLQGDLAEDGFTDVEEGDVLLLQIGEYQNGVDWHGWGPGGLIYFTIDPDSLSNHEFGKIRMSVQCT